MSKAYPIVVVTSDNVILVGDEALDMALALGQEHVKAHVLDMTSDQVNALDSESFSLLIEECHRRLDEMLDD